MKDLIMISCIIKKYIGKYDGDFSIKAENGTFTLEVGFQVSGD